MRYKELSGKVKAGLIDISNISFEAGSDPNGKPLGSDPGA